jgi:hypothetical protein
MLSMRFLILFGVGLAAGAPLLFSGCFDYQDDCVYTLQCAQTASSGGTGGGDGGLPPSCDPTQSTAAVADSCGLFVSPDGDDNNPGSKTKPLKTLGAAVTQGGPIYACTGTSPYTEVITVNKPVTIFGALDCGSWAYQTGTKSQLTAPAGMVPLTLSSKADGSAIHDFAITAADAAAAGGSSIAVVADHAGTTLVDVDVAAGKGADGAPGMMPPMQVTTPATADGSAGNPDASCNMPGVLGGAGGMNMCTGIDTGGGLGGQGATGTTGGNGNGGNPTMTPSNGGAGQSTSACGQGQPGAPGAPGMSGMGAQGIGDIGTSGYVATAATMGGPGAPGQGGGGGGGAKGCSATGAGPSGGGGGAGGCPGAAGAPAGSAGSSIGIIALDAPLTLTSVTVITHTGGTGGLGGDGQAGGNGGMQGLGGGAGACAGGPGGQGGVGGAGGGGAGGHSVGIAIKGGMAPDLKGATVTHGTGGAGGPGGNMGMDAQAKGSDGLGCKTLDFGNPTSSMACAM